MLIIKGMNRIEKLVEARWKHWQIRQLGDVALSNGDVAARVASELCEDEERQRLGSFSLEHARRLPYVPGNQFVEGGREIPPPDLVA